MLKIKRGFLNKKTVLFYDAKIIPFTFILLYKNLDLLYNKGSLHTYHKREAKMSAITLTYPVALKTDDVLPEFRIHIFQAIIQCL